MKVEFDTRLITIDELKNFRRYLTSEIKRREINHKKFIEEKGL